MQGRMIFLLEEPSMKTLLEGLLPRLFPGMVAGEHFLCIKHEGKSDLDASIPRKLQAWRIPNDRCRIQSVVDRHTRDDGSLQYRSGGHRSGDSVRDSHGEVSALGRPSFALHSVGRGQGESVRDHDLGVHHPENG